MKYEEFLVEFIKNIRNESLLSNELPDQVFLNEMVVHLEEMEYLFNPQIIEFYKVGSYRRIMKFDLYAYDETDKSLILLSNEFIDDKEPAILPKKEIEQIAQRMLNYLDEINSGSIHRFVDPSQDAAIIAREIGERLSINFVDYRRDDSIDRIKLFIITNRKLSDRIKNIKLENFLGRQVELNVWDIERIYEIEKSGRVREPIYVDFEKLNGGTGLPYLKADFKNEDDYEAYLSIIPGKLLSDIYWEHGSRLLESNVRAFLSIRGKINRGIRNTILREPSNFFTYNNGIACTATRVEISNDGKYITLIEDLQIINGGQTTASLTSAWKKDKSDLDKIFVPMKLTIIKTENPSEMIQNISKYANSQNRVTDADFFSNHPFHIEMEKLSKKIIAPAIDGVGHNTYWFYERSRGKYQQMFFKLRTKSEINKLGKKYPKRQVIKKEDLAKYLMAGIFLRPDWVSRGRARNMTEFAKRIDKMWKDNKNIFNETYFKHAISYAILFISTDKLVAKASWYNVGGVKLNIVPYTISKLISSLPNDMMIDLNKIWRNQSLDKELLNEINLIAQKANNFINDSKGVIPTEYAKKEDTWKAFYELDHKLSKPFLDTLINKSLLIEAQKSSEKEKKLDETINIEKEIFELAITENRNYWQRLTEEGLRRNLISHSEKNILEKYIFEISKPIPRRFPSPSQLKIVWKVRERLEENGVLV